LEERKCETKGSKGTLKTLMPPIGVQKLEGSENPKCTLEPPSSAYIPLHDVNTNRFLFLFFYL
jgi:hypothetical protein